MDRRPLNPSSSSNQARSGLTSLKRSWSGTSKDLGATNTFSKSSQQASQGGASASGSQGKPSGSQRSVRESSAEVFYDGWSSSPDVPESAMSSGKHSLASSSADGGPAKRPRSGLQNPTTAGESKGRTLPSIFGQSSSDLLKSKRATSSQSIFSKPGNVAENGPKPTYAKVFLSTEQQMVLSKVVDRQQNVFYTGSAGTGKSVLLREIIKELRTRHARNPDAVAITASTGIAACNVGGTTLHSFAGIGLGAGTVPQLMAFLRKNRKSVARWLKTKVLIIDEVSMLDADLFDKLEEIARMLRKSTKPFGGIQLIVTGDFFQLPPVTYNNQPKFAFEAKCWNSAINFQYNLTQVFRQKDQTFIDMLNEMRFGKLTPKSIAIFKSLNRVPKYGEGIEPTELFPRREDVEKANTNRLAALDSSTRIYNAIDTGRLATEQREKLLGNFIAPKSLSLKINAQVMLIKNVDEGLVNGSIGHIVDFKTVAGASREEGGVPDGLRVKAEKIPDGLRVKAEKMEGGGSGIAAGGAVGSSRSRSMSPVKGAAEEGPEFPYVFFPQTNRYLLCKPDSWKNEDNMGEVLAERHQVPLILAWAMSIHKAQGQTIPCCRIDLRRIFEKGQAYVALSRATSLEGLQVLGFDPSKVMAHPRVINWSRKTFENTS
ncbi:unnamed protein product [Tilletia controversa]|uniref:ATP-dependent DNA helicase PIF1 n=3 Tax=Tilletia TaxID=13289 RepID=A0A8X7SWK2_9BASI|nr:hypothetical protein CF328_g3992 [Tilletia controversa]KAE8199503.1 hypothetical protein CF336_g1165 [Tilletia laevis]KAE8260891.1 hypothetical protein A4X03_0g3673 [Tilletia caries]KAE8202414.1 hypothetical protein CF335_g3424 [Tilletia laevis]KAE8247101.1 hypothetical protein A4X06_0g4703 [Tilletia controversa]